MAGERAASISQSCPACGATIDTTDAEPLARIACPKCDEKVRVERSFDNFVLVETLGVGGMGTVYKARDTLLDRFVALKLLRKDIGGGVDQTVQLRQEARVAASVNHPNVIQVFSSGIDHGQFYLVMELVDHGSLDDFIEQRKRLPEEQALEAGIQVAKGLRAAHAKGLIHRDVKPANILFADEHTAKIGDFGLAGVAAEKAETLGEIWGTPYYVAPERLNNEPEDLRSDIYSLGATLFHAVAGKAPIEGETNSAIALLNLKKKPLDLRRIAPDASAATARVFHRMIAPNPLHRFSSYDELVRELERAQRARIGKERVATLRARQKRRRLLAITGALLLILIALGGFLFLHKPRPRPSLLVPVAAPSAIPIGELERQFGDARRELIQGEHIKAHADFARLAMEANKRQPLYDWLRLNEGLAALVGREQSQAWQAFQNVQDAGQTGFKKEDVDLGKWFVTTATTMTTQEMVPADTREQNPFALLLFALQDVAHANATNAAPLLERFLKSQPLQETPWISDYKRLAEKYLDDCHTYIAWKNAMRSMEPAAALAKVTSLETKMPGPIRDALKSDKQALKEQISQRQRGDAAAREDAKRKQIEQAVQKKPQWLTDWKSKLINDLNQRHFKGAIGKDYTGIESATTERLTMRLPYGTIPINWTQLPPQSLLAISESFIQPNAADAADRQWLCAVYASETGQTDAAKQLAEAAAESKPEYRELLPVVAK